jgi:hypothetical protein
MWQFGASVIKVSFTNHPKIKQLIFKNVITRIKEDETAIVRELLSKKSLFENVLNII